MCQCVTASECLHINALCTYRELCLQLLDLFRRTGVLTKGLQAFLQRGGVKIRLYKGAPDWVVYLAVTRFNKKNNSAYQGVAWTVVDVMLNWQK